MKAQAPLPLVATIAYRDPCELFAHFKDREGAIFLDSAQRRENCGRYSFIAIDPFQILKSKNGVLTCQGTTLSGNPFDFLAAELLKFKQESLKEVPGFQGGAAGYLGYELAQHLERLPQALKDDRAFPDLVLGFYDVVLGFDCIHEEAWICSSGFPELELAKRSQRAKVRLQAMVEELNRLTDLPPSPPAREARLKIEADIAPFAYKALVKRALAYILAGDIFEVNLSQRFWAKLPPAFSVFELYLSLRLLNPAPFAAYLHFSEATILSASPERFLELKAGQVEARPIKGTAARGKTLEEDAKLAQGLQASEKDRAENIMIVDLMRNDLSRVCEASSVKVLKLCGLETYSTVHHLVSVVIGKLRPGLGSLDLLKASFPGGSITGAPKLRAMEIIAELEPTQRGPYCGSILYLGFDGQMDSSITIRSFYVQQDRVSFQAGGAVVADSKPELEQAEVLTKAQALFDALRL